MNVLRGDYRNWKAPVGGLAVAIGVFDGFHAGHRAVISSLIESSGGFGSCVLTFHPHPLAIVAPDHVPPLLTSTEQKTELLAAAGVETVALLEFDEHVRSLTPAQFIDEVLVATLDVKVVVVGEDFRFGFRHSGDVGTLRDAGRDKGFTVVGVGLVGEGLPLSSTSIRAVLDAGDVQAAALALGRPFSLRGVVVHGDGRGTTIGIPTANLEIDSTLLVPRRGVYATVARIGGVRHDSVTNIGIRPTFGGTLEAVEVHVFDFAGDLYGQEIDIAFVERIRHEQRFESANALVDQIHRDIEEAAVILR